MSRAKTTATSGRGAGQPPELPATVSLRALLENGKDHLFRKLLYDLGYLGDLMGSARRHLAAEFDLTPPEYNVVMVVAEFEGELGVSVVEVAKHLHVTGAFVTQQANALVAKKLLEKRPNPNDGRGILLGLTVKASSGIQKNAPNIRAFNDSFFSALDRESFREFSAVVERLIGSGERALLEASTSSDKLSGPIRREAIKRRLKR